MSADDLEIRLRAYLAELQRTHVSVSSVTEPEEAWNVHVLDSLVALDIDELRSAKRLADIGSGGGFPGVALAAALPQAQVDLVESVNRKCEFMRQALKASGIGNAEVVCKRAEDWGKMAGRERYDVVCARALGSLATVAELASPLLVDRGLLVAWKGTPLDAELRDFEISAPRSAMVSEGGLPVEPFVGSGIRKLYLVRKSGSTPGNLPRRPGMAAKRPLGS